MHIQAFDFAARTERALSPDQFADALAAGQFCWIDLDAGDIAPAPALLHTAGLPAAAIAAMLGPDREGRYDLYDECLHFAASEACWTGERFGATHVDAIIAERVLVTFHRTEAACIARMRQTCRDDFRRFAQTPGFLLYELADHLTDGYSNALHALAERSDRLQQRLFDGADREVFPLFAETADDIRKLRRIIVAARELLHELGQRRSPFVSESTQPFLERQAAALERLAEDLAAEREALSSALSLYMGVQSHRTGRLINRLTVISMVFLPLTFICGIYGMNFDGMPELHWPYGYALFWAVAIVVTGSLLALMKRQKWI